ncbi:MAG: 4Fe-4S dicluster domain-containing protein, partial [Phycisphaerales bacterium]|nr:4Fe-4S dicluster domain-containing protein [Phycisphaerales bacterium]
MSTSITINVNGRDIEARKGEMIIKALERDGIHVPTLCYMKDLAPTGACRMCVVEIEGQRTLAPSCAFPVAEGMVIQTHSPRVKMARKTIIELLLADHPDDCLYCERSGQCQLQTLAIEYDVRQRRVMGSKSHCGMDFSSPSLVRDPDKCILCGKCVRICEEVQHVSAIDFTKRGSESLISTTFDQGLNISSCINCGQCITVCPTGALREKRSIREVAEALNDPEMTVVVQHAPAVSVALGEEFGMKQGTDVVGVMHTAFRRLGFDNVFSTSFTADLTIMEEATELVQRVTGGGALPMFTSCSPGWVKFVEQYHPDFLKNISTCKSPQQMMGAVIKTYFAEKNKIDPAKIFSVSVMPCTAKKFEITRPGMGRDGVRDVDAVLTTRELAKMIRAAGLDLSKLEPTPADTPFGNRSTAGKLFGASGGVMEAALRTGYFLITGNELEDLKFEAVRGLDGIKEAKIPITDDLTIGVAVASSLA